MSRIYRISNDDLGLIHIALRVYREHTANPILKKELEQVLKRLIEQ